MLNGESRPPCSAIVRCQKVESPGSCRAWKQTTAMVIAKARVNGRITLAYRRAGPVTGFVADAENSRASDGNPVPPARDTSWSSVAPYVAKSGPNASGANFVIADKPSVIPRATGEVRHKRVT